MFKVAVVDDEYRIRMGLRKLIESLGFQVVGEAADGREALELIVREQPHLVVADISMPVMDGMALIAELRQRQLSMEIIILSGYQDFSYAQQAIRYQVHDYLLKPIDPDHFEQLLLRMYEQHRHQPKMWMERGRRLWAHIALGDQLSEALWQLDEEMLARQLERVAQAYRQLAGSAVERQQWCIDLAMYAAHKLAEKSGRSFPIHWQSPDDSPESCRQLAELCRSWRRVIAESRNLGQRVQIQRAMAYIDKHYADDDLSLHDTAEHVSMSTTYFSRLFKEETGWNFVKYLTDVRMRHAEQLLTSPDYKVGDVALAVGYTSYYHFAKTFKKVKGMSPTDFRKTNGCY